MQKWGITLLDDDAFRCVYIDVYIGGDKIIYIFFPGTGDIKWNFIYGLFENAIYGGRIDNIWDIRVLNAYLRIFFNNDVIGGRKPSADQLAKSLALPTTVNYQVRFKENSPYVECGICSWFYKSSKMVRKQGYIDWFYKGNKDCLFMTLMVLFFMFQDYTSLIRNLSDEDDPSYFGLPANIERSWQRIVSTQVISQLKGL